MNIFRGKKPKTSQRAFALIASLLMLLLISAVLMGMIMMSNTETNVSANFRDEQTAFFAAKAGVEEARDRMRSTATNSLSGNLPTTALPGAANGVLYITNPAPGETVTPWLPLGTNYPDDEICKEVTCTSGVPTGTWYATPQSASTSYAASPILTWKWVRVMAKANNSDTGTTRVTSVDGTTNGNRVCWTGTNEIVTTAASCDAASSNSYQPVYELTALAVTSSRSRRMTQYEVSRNPFPSMPGAVVFDGSNPNFGPPSSNVFTVNGTDAAQGPNAGAGCGPATNEPALGAFDNASVTTLQGDISGRSSNYISTSPAPAVGNVNSALGNLTTVDGLTNLVNSITAAAGSNVYGTNPSGLNLGTNTAPVANVVQGDLTVSGASGAGILLVTGELTMSGNFAYNGLSLVIGEGAVVKNGGGGATLNGALFAANLYSDIPPPGGYPSYSHPIALGANAAPGIPYFNWNGGGNATIQYDSCWISTVNQSLPLRIVAQRELIY